MVDNTSCAKKNIIELNGSGSQRLKATVVKAQKTSDTEIKEPIVYDYMKYPNRKKSKTGNQYQHKVLKAKKSVSFKRIVELVSFTDDWKMKTSESNLRTEEEQVQEITIISFSLLIFPIVGEKCKFETKFLECIRIILWFLCFQIELQIN